jgi:Uma2 family endonuclease
MNTFVVDRESVSIPDWVEDLDSFRRWARSEEFPDEGRVCYLQGEVWVDISKEQAFSHNQVKNAYAYTLTGLANTRVPGRFFPDGMLLTNESAGLASRPDGIFVAEATLDAGLVRLIEGDEEGFVELEGSPDMVMEIISTSSVKKNKRTLPPLYWQAKISEYWLVDARDQRLDFDILRHTPRGYVPNRKQGGWVKSNVFGCSFRLSRNMDKRGHPVFAVETR